MASTQLTTPRRYILVIQDERGYPAPGDDLEPAPPDGPTGPVLHTVVKADDYEALVAERDRYREALEKIAQHARLDERERGFGEASRYYGIAEDAYGANS